MFQPNAESKGLTALIIDDDPLFHEVASYFLHACGFRSVFRANNGLEGLDIIVGRDYQIDFVLCDLQMPEMDGAQVLRELAKNRFPGDVAIITSEETTLRDSVCEMAKMSGLNVAGAMSKPLSLNELQRLIATQSRSSTKLDETIEIGELVDAIESRQLRPFYQPKIDIQSGKVIGFETLCRHVGENGTIGPPTTYIKSAMSFSLMGSLTRSMIEQIIEDMTDWHERIGALNVAINMSPVCIVNPNLPDKIAHKFRSAGFDLDRITFEVTEERLMEDQAVILEVLSRLRLLGFRLSLDDFGTGAASIERLRKFPFNEVKIDRQFVMDAAHDEFARLTVSSAIELAKMRNMTVVAEGVETPEVLSLMTDLGIDIAQGFLFSPAISPSDVTTWMESWRKVLSV